MNTHDRRDQGATPLRRRAEAITLPDRTSPGVTLDRLSPEQSRKMLRELQVHQIELQMQNEELHRAQTELDAARARYFDLFDLAPVGYCTLKEDGLILEANCTAANLLGVAHGALVNERMTRFILDEDQDTYYLKYKQYFESHAARAVPCGGSDGPAGRTGPAQLCELRMVRKDGTVFWANLAVSAALGSNGESLCRVVLNDVSARKRADEEKAGLESQLQQAQKMESVGRLAGGVAHDFNNMLGVILGHVELAIEQVDTVLPLYANLTEIRKAAIRSADLTRQLLTFARKQAAAPVVLDLNETVAGMLTMLKRLIGEDIDLQWRPAPDLWPVKVDPTQVDQVLANLCVNARDAISGIGRITIETNRCALSEDHCAQHLEFVPGEYVRLTVRDNGCGMGEEILLHLFEPFYTTKVMGKGTGLGLATVYGIVRQNNGIIDVSSEVGQGTAFEVYLPRHLGTAEPAPAVARVRAPRGTETILLVEDEPAVLALTTAMLERQGYIVLPACTPSQAIWLASEHLDEIHLLMTDVVMPEMNGRALAKDLLDLNPRLKRLYMSGYAADVIAHNGVLDEGVSLLQKPFSMERLASAVREALDRE
jgi:signal transduction histidine kinase/ActR/RegA family two-component response regulator